MPSRGRRPQTSASESTRPSTASTSTEPVSLAWNSLDHSFPHPDNTANTDHGYHLYTQHEEDFEDDESDDEDVFAFVPPTTAQQQGEEPTDPSTEPNPHLDPPPPPFTESPAFSRIVDPPKLAHGDLPPPPPLEPSPPQTNSTQEHDIVDSHNVESYRMSRLSTSSPTPLSAPLTANTLSREVHVSLPSRGDTGSDLPTGSTFARPHKRSPSSEASTSVIMDLDLDSSLKMDIEAGEDDPDEDSPYPEVRASVSNIDDPSMPTLTFRMWTIGLTLCMIAAAMNMFFNFRQPAPIVIPLVLILVAHPLGKFAAYILPLRTWKLPRLLGGTEFSLNPGPFNVKEHVLIFIMANVSIAPAYAMNVIVVSEMFYSMRRGFWFDFTLILATQLTGFGLAGITRRFLVWPASMIWPQNLVACTLLNTLHAEDEDKDGGITRYKFFMIAFACAFVYFFLPGFLFTALSIFSWACWIAPQNVVVNQLFGVESGLGFGLITFDWAQISWIGSPLMVPWWAEVHVFAGFVLFYWILLPAMYYSNVWRLAYLPILSSLPYDRFGKPYNITGVLLPDYTFNKTAYDDYSPMYLPAAYVITYLLAFAVSTCVIVHTLLYHGRSLLNGVKKMKIEKDDIHFKLMKNYPEVPDWWYMIFLCLFFVLAIVAVERWHTRVPVWALCLSLLLPVIYILPGGFIYAMTGQPITLNLLAQIIPGTLLPGNAFANMVFKAYSIQTLGGAINFAQDLKLGHYIKVPPRATFLVQVLSTGFSVMVQVGVKQWMFTHIPDICQAGQKDSLTCPHNQVYFTASAVWGLIGPQRQFGTGSIYHPELYAMIFGALIPLPFWFWQRRFPKSRLKYISTPVIINGVSQIPPSTGINYSSWFIAAFIFQYLIRRLKFAWWSKFNYVLSAALDSGTVMGVLVVFFCLQFPKGDTLSPNWWGNTVYLNTADNEARPLLKTPPGGF